MQIFDETQSYIQFLDSRVEDGEIFLMECRIWRVPDGMDLFVYSSPSFDHYLKKIVKVKNGDYKLVEIITNDVVTDDIKERLTARYKDAFGIDITFKDRENNNENKRSDQPE